MSQIFNTSTDTSSWEEADTLISILRTWGVEYLVGLEHASLSSRREQVAPLELIYFDFYSIALSKIERGTTHDIEDVKLLVQQQRIAVNELDVAYQEVLAQLGKGRYPKVTPEHFAEWYAALRPML